MRRPGPSAAMADYDCALIHSAPDALPLRSVNAFAMDREVEAFALHIVTDAQSDNKVDDLEDDQRCDGAVDEHDHDASELVENLTSDQTARFTAGFTPINPGGFDSNWCGAAFIVAGKIDLTAAANLK